MTKHVVDHRRGQSGGRLLHFLAIARQTRATWHRHEARPNATRIVQFCRIARGRLV